MLDVFGRLADRVLVRFVPHGRAAASVCPGYWQVCGCDKNEGLMTRKRCYTACQGIPAYCETTCQHYASRC